MTRKPKTVYTADKSQKGKHQGPLPSFWGWRVTPELAHGSLAADGPATTDAHTKLSLRISFDTRLTPPVFQSLSSFLGPTLGASWAPLPLPLPQHPSQAARSNSGQGTNGKSWVWSQGLVPSQEFRANYRTRAGCNLPRPHGCGPRLPSAAQQKPAAVVRCTREGRSVSACAALTPAVQKVHT